jgi:hypothetical protein
MTTKDIRTSHAHTICDVCGRTLLRGERAEIYIDGAARHSVCELCRPRALQEGWVREGTLPDYSQSGAGSERRRSLLNRLRQRRGGRRSQARPSLDDELAGYAPIEPVRGRPNGRPHFEDDLDEDRWEALEPPGEDSQAESHANPEPYRAYDPEEAWDDEDDGDMPPTGDLLDQPPPGDERRNRPPEDPEPRGRRPWSRPPRSLGAEPPPTRGGRPTRPTRPTRPGRPSRRPRAADALDPTGRETREPRHVRAVPAGEAQKMAAAVDLFNQSEHRRTVAGVARSLGGADVAVLPAAEPPSLVHIVVSWELCWYRYTVDLSDVVPGVRVDGQGYELSELSDAERTANATADESGQLIVR